MEKAILKTLIYSDIFNYPLKAWEIHKWLISKKASLVEVEKGLRNLARKSKINSKKGFYFLNKKDKLAGIRTKREGYSAKLLTEAIVIANLLRVIPWIKAVGISGSLSLSNSKKDDDIDFFIITSRGRLWISRLLTLVILQAVGKRRRRGDQRSAVKAKICANLFLEEDQLAQKYHDLYTAHEVLQMKLVWQKNNIYQKFLADNNWAFKYLPNWTSKISGNLKKPNRLVNKGKDKSLIDMIENLVRIFQFKKMGKITGSERVSEASVYFHPDDYRPKIMEEYKTKLKTLKNRVTLEK